MSDASAEAHGIGVVGGRGQFRQPRDIDQEPWRGETQVHHRHQRLAAGDHARLPPVFRQQADSFGQAAWPDVIDSGRFHD
jgi:hypothetical protein